MKSGGDDRRRLYAICTDFRLQIEGHIKERQLSKRWSYCLWWKEFPNGCCSDASELLAMYLHECHSFDKTSIRLSLCNEMKDGRSHAWLYVGDYLVDVTADQFEGVADPVVVTKASKWHKAFRGGKIVPYETAIGCSSPEVKETQRDILQFLASQQNVSNSRNRTTEGGNRLPRLTGLG